MGHRGGQNRGGLLPLKRKEGPIATGRDDESDISGRRGHRDVESGRAGDRTMVSERAEESTSEKEFFSQSIHQRHHQDQPGRPRIGLDEDVVQGWGDERQMLADQVGNKEAQEGGDAECKLRRARPSFVMIR